MVSRTGDFLFSLFKGNLAVKLLSLALAITVWGFTFVSRETRQEVVLPVELVNIPQGHAPVLQKQREVVFTLYGTSSQLRRAGKDNRKIALNLNGAVAPGKTVFSNLEKHLNLHPDVRVIRTSPAALEIELVGKPANQNQGEQHK